MNENKMEVRRLSRRSVVDSVSFAVGRAAVARIASAKQAGLGCQVNKAVNLEGGEI